MLKPEVWGRGMVWKFHDDNDDDDDVIGWRKEILWTRDSEGLH